MTSYIIKGREGNLKLSFRQKNNARKMRNRITMLIKEVNIGFLAYLGSINFIR